MTRRQLTNAAAIFLASGALGPAQSGAATLTVQMSEASGKSGTVKFALFHDESGFPSGQPFRSVSVEMKDGKASTMFKDLEPGIYAATAYLDKNNNGKLDKNRLGKPTEPYGFSNEARGMFGPPKFEDARFKLIAGETKLSFELK